MRVQEMLNEYYEALQQLSNRQASLRIKVFAFGCQSSVELPAGQQPTCEIGLRCLLLCGLSPH